jgi:crotonobetainyl-CoA:carnitine CoA-transferase CaiB-like acyl-CoA transferase
VLPLIENSEAAVELITKSIRSKPFEYWREHLKTMKGQWAPFQSLVELGTVEQAIANDMIVEVEATDGGAPFKVVRGPVQFNHEPLETTRAPQASEHTEIGMGAFKYAASLLGLPIGDYPHSRPPQAQLPEEGRAQIRTAYQRFGLIAEQGA